MYIHYFVKQSETTKFCGTILHTTVLIDYPKYFLFVSPDRLKSKVKQLYTLDVSEYII